METVENAKESNDRASSPKPKSQLAPTVGTVKGTAADLTCPLHELQFFEKRKATRAQCVRWGSYKSRLHGRPGLCAALFNLAPGTTQQDELAKAKSLGENSTRGCQT